MLTTLGHGAIVCRDDHKRMLVFGDPSHHVVDEPMVSRDVDEAQAALVGIGEAEIDGESAFLFLLERVCIDAGELAH